MAINHDRVRGDGHLFVPVGKLEAGSVSPYSTPSKSEYSATMHLADYRQATEIRFCRCISREKDLGTSVQIMMGKICCLGILFRQHPATISASV